MKDGKRLIDLGVGLTLVGLAIFVATFYPTLKQEWFYKLQTTRVSDTGLETIVPVDGEFGIVIPKIGANSKIVADVDPFDARAYQSALTKGVAHAKNTVTPDKDGNMFLFSHSSVNFYEAQRYNSIFYLLNKLEEGDEITVYYQDEPYNYFVTDTKLVNPDEVEYLLAKTDKKQLTMMTCWPPGTTYKRMLVTAEAVNL